MNLEPTKLRLTYSKTGLIRFTSHRDLLRNFFRAFARAGWPLAFSRGFSPHPRVEFCPPLKVGMEGENELLDVELARPVEPSPAVERLNKTLPQGMTVKEAAVLPAGSPTLSKAVRGAEYLVELTTALSVNSGKISEFLSAAEVWVEKRKGREVKKIEVRQGITGLELDENRGELKISLEGSTGPFPVLSALLGEAPERLAGLRCRRLGWIR